MGTGRRTRRRGRLESKISMKSEIIGRRIKLRDKKLSDVRDDYRWESNPELSRLDAATPLTISFPEYLLSHASAVHGTSSSRRVFAIDTLDGKHIGNCVYYGIDELAGEAELGIMIGNSDYWNKGYGAEAVTLLLGYIFSHTTLNRVHLKTLETNYRAQKCFRKCGFIHYEHAVRDGYSFMLMQIYRKDWEKQQQSEAREGAIGK